MHPLDAILHQLKSQPFRTWSVVITLFGDAALPRGGSLWLGTLLPVFDAMGIAPGALRTAVSRLSRDEWLSSTRIGRNSFYRLTPGAEAASRAAAPRIYGAPDPAWDGQFHLILTPDAAGKPALQAAGCGTLAPGIWVAPPGAIPPQAAGLPILHATADPATARLVAGQAWPLTHTHESYRGFIELFTPLAAAPALSGAEAMVARTLAVHEFRRVVLRDPGLPAALLPPDWPGTAARALCASIYEGVAQASEAWLDEHGRNETGPLPPASTNISGRFETHSRVTEFT